MTQLLCWLLKHRVEVVQVFGSHATRFVCVRCEREFIRKDYGEHAGLVLPWDKDFAELYEAFGYPIRNAAALLSRGEG